MEAHTKVFKDLTLLVEGNADQSLLDVIASHVMSAGMNEKVKKLREEFFSKLDFQAEKTKLVSHTGFENTRKGLEDKIKQ